jgi:hypothetical protein
MQLSALEFHSPASSMRSSFDLKRLASSDRRLPSQVTGSFNPSEGGTWHVISLQLLALELRRKVSDAEQAIADRADGSAGAAWACSPLFGSDRSVWRVADAIRYMEALEHLILSEVDDSQRDMLVCCHNLLTGHDALALELYALLRTDGLPPDVARLQEMLLDRDVQVAR